MDHGCTTEINVDIAGDKGYKGLGIKLSSSLKKGSRSCSSNSSRKLVFIKKWMKNVKKNFIIPNQFTAKSSWQR